MSRKEFTQGIVNELKQKIYEFKNKKQSEKAERKNELDFEINQDLVNKFKRNHNASSEENKEGLGEIIKKEKFNLENQYSSNKQNFNLNEGTNKKNNEFNFDFNINKIRKANTSSYEDKTRNPKVESKRVEVLNSILNNNERLNKKKTYTSSNQLNSIKQYSTIDIPSSKTSSTKEKIQDFVFQFNKLSPNQESKPQRNSYTSNNSPSYKYISSYQSKKTNLPPYGTKKSNDVNLFADFGTKKNSKQRIIGSDIFSDDKIKDYSSTINTSEVRALSGKIRFLSKDEIRHMDNAVIDELLSLSNNIKRTFSNVK